MTEKTADQWAIVELFGHKKIAGRISEQTLGGCSFVRIDVPEVDGAPAWTRLYGQGAIYSISFTDEETARGAVRMLAEVPVDVWTARQILRLEHDDEYELYDGDAF
jgi:hypothetical protein